MKQLVITIIGEDRPGLVEQVSNAVLEHHGSWQASRFSKLSGYFAGILQIAVQESNIPALTLSLKSISDLDIQISEPSSKEPVDTATHQLAVTGNDRPGIVQEATRVLAGLGINIVKLTTHTESAANTGTMIFSARFDLGTGQESDLDSLQDALEALSDDLIVELESLK
ncbi:amino acid-binding protein [Parasalinivibrio latis]|uniref:glycine cleavage system protein R n=1 Tax=Parasalinivibrio latis TaxID=2952610 RepID=UPI0030DE9307